MIEEVKYKIEEVKYYKVFCKCGREESVKDLNDVNDELEGWTIESNQYPITKNSIKSVLCANCTEELRLKNYKSTDIRTRINAGYYEDYPERWDKDVKEDLGIVGNRKADILLSMAFERGHSSGMLEVYNEACELVVLIKD